MGADIIQDKFENLDMSKRDEVTELTKLEVMAVLRQSIRPEFLNRIDEIIMFTPLNKAEVTKIVKLQLDGLANLLKSKDITFSVTNEAIECLANKGFDPQFGARPIKRVIQKEVLNKLSKELLANKISAQSHILLDAFNDEFVFRNK